MGPPWRGVGTLTTDSVYGSNQPRLPLLKPRKTRPLACAAQTALTCPEPRRTRCEARIISFVDGGFFLRAALSAKSASLTTDAFHAPDWPNNSVTTPPG